MWKHKHRQTKTKKTEIRQEIKNEQKIGKNPTKKKSLNSLTSVAEEKDAEVSLFCEENLIFMKTEDNYFTSCVFGKKTHFFSWPVQQKYFRSFWADLDGTVETETGELSTISWRGSGWPGLPDFSWYLQYTKAGKNIPNDYKITQCP
jgi:hypothetical protein